MKIIVVKGPSERLHCLRNVGEAVYGKFSFDGIAEVPDMDTAVTELHIKVKSARHLGDVTTFLKKTLKRYGLLEIVEISPED